MPPGRAAFPSSRLARLGMCWLGFSSHNQGRSGQRYSSKSSQTKRSAWTLQEDGTFTPSNTRSPQPSPAAASLRGHSWKGLHSSSPPTTTPTPTTSTTKCAQKAKLLRRSGLIKAAQRAGGPPPNSQPQSPLLYHTASRTKRLGLWGGSEPP